MKYLCIIIAIALLIVGIILIVSKAKGKVVDNKVQRNVGGIVIGIIMCIVSIAYFIGCYTYTTNNYDRLLTTKSDLSKRVTMMMSNYDEVKSYNDRYDRVTDSIFSFICYDEEVSKFDINELDKQGYIIKPSTTKYVLKPSH